ncbi:uncharacterized protein CTHT_0020770 [Thermochaetoides thermophila DSM 1495]|uniref:Uncharacterized protein n=1 Tax=Chaetomium thermophilum (strain DSM 1495 / CBS 144.50 / IMI 039719) TaxID=759272 RepID=G0S3E9_CHATD|nr:hypothetical protein CTHT_0020770 [Thermochaetoides thermophila DSM 1495]EGS22532.1 hypothetical protein CTHT_0020770 [Thermochaetoides thermophila DSM 1495]
MVNMPTATARDNPGTVPDQQQHDFCDAAQTMTLSQSDQSQINPMPVRKRPCIRRVTRPELGSLYDIMHEHAGVALYVLPICWTDLHAKLLDVRFEEMPVINRPIPDLPPGMWVEPSRLAQNLTNELHTLVREEGTPQRIFCKNRAIKHIMSTFFPETMSRPKSDAQLNLYFGKRVFRKVVRVPCVWKSVKSSDASFDSCLTVPATSFSQGLKGSRDTATDYSPNAPIMAYFNKSQLASIRRNLYTVIRGPNNTPNEPVTRLQQLRSKMLTPSNPDYDPYLVAVFLAMAQAHFYREPPSRASSPPESQSQSQRKSIRLTTPKFRDIKLRIITHDEGNDSTPNFVIYTAVVTTSFMERFLHPHKAPPAHESGPGMTITCTPVTVWPILGLKERLAKALGTEIAGEPMFADPEYIALWDALLDQPRTPKQEYSTPSPPPTAPGYRVKRRKRSATPEVSQQSQELDRSGSSFDEEASTRANSPVESREEKKNSGNSISSLGSPSGSASATGSASDDRPVLSPAAKRRRTTRRVSTLEVC